MAFSMLAAPDSTFRVEVLAKALLARDSSPSQFSVEWGEQRPLPPAHTPQPRRGPQDGLVR
jgi:hypothetical protein